VLPIHWQIFAWQVYYDILSGAGKAFIDTAQIIRTYVVVPCWTDLSVYSAEYLSTIGGRIGFGLFDLRAESLNDMIKSRLGKPVLNLDFLLKDVVEDLEPLDWERFWTRQEKIPLKVSWWSALYPMLLTTSCQGGREPMP
jgi:hypothetical protein